MRCFLYVVVCEMSPASPCVVTFGPQLVMLFCDPGTFRSWSIVGESGSLGVGFEVV